MERTGLQQSGDLYLQDGFWRLRWSEGAMDGKPSWIGPATGPERLTREQAERIARENFLSRTELDARTPQSFQQWCESLLWELGREITEPRRNRINPRVIKRKMSKWLKKRPEHRHPPPLTKTFDESVVMVT